MQIALWLFGHEVFDLQINRKLPLGDDDSSHLVTSPQLHTELEERGVLCGHCDDCDEEFAFRLGFTSHFCKANNASV